MQILRTATRSEIETHLLSLGAGNHKDNIESISHFQYYYLVQLNEIDFFNLVFLHNHEVRSIVSLNDRSLEAVVRCAMITSYNNLSDNWNLSANFDRFLLTIKNSNTVEMPALLIRDANVNEREHGTWYLQDGSHRALAYGMYVIRRMNVYHEQKAFCATDKLLGL